MRLLQPMTFAVALGLGSTTLALPTQAADAQKSGSSIQEAKAAPNQKTGQSKGLAQTGEYSGPCAPAFAMVDSSNDGQISKKEAEFSRDQAFKRIDANGNGDISMAEYRECFAGDLAKAASSGKVGSKQMASAKTNDSAQSDHAAMMDEYFGEADIDKDQQVTREEYMRAAKKAYSNAAGSSGKVESGAYGKAMDNQAWDPTAADLDQDNQISADEAAAHAARKFAALDDNGNGKVNKEEWFGRVMYDQVELQKRADISFNAMDEDENKKLSRKEFMKIGDEHFQTASAEAGGGELVPVWVYRRVYIW